MKIHRFDAPPGHDGAWLPLLGQRADALPLRYALLERFEKGWSSPEEELKALQALAGLNVLPDDAVFYLIASVLVDEIAPTRLLSFLDEIQESDVEERAAEVGEPLRVEDHWEFIAEHVTAETMREHDEWDMAHLFEHDRCLFQNRVESGRRFFHGVQFPA